MSFFKSLLTLVLVCGGLWLGGTFWIMTVADHNIARNVAAQQPANDADTLAYCERLRTHRPAAGDDLEAVRLGSVRPDGTLAAANCPDFSVLGDGRYHARK